MCVLIVRYLFTSHEFCSHVVQRVPFGEVKQLSHKTLQKRLGTVLTRGDPPHSNANLDLTSWCVVLFYCKALGSFHHPTDEQSLLPLLSQATESQLVSLFSSETELDDNLLTLARNLCAVRPVKGLFGMSDKYLFICIFANEAHLIRDPR